MIALIFWWVCLVFLISLFIRIVLSYFRVMPGSPLEGLNRTVVGITDPILRPVRRLIPPARIGMGALDLSPMIVGIAVIIVMNLLR